MPAMSSSQHNLLSFLQKPSSYPHKPEEVKIVQTHASILAITPPFVYKFKKQFDFGFMDFRELEARKNNCQRELELNRRLCQAVYLEVLPLYYKDKQLSFRPGGSIVDYALKMRQLPDGYFFNQLLDKGELGTSQLEQLLQRLKSFYQQQPADPSISHYGNISHLQQITEENFKSLRKMKKLLFSPQALEAIERETNHFYLHQADLLERRVKEGNIKDCHGDLHLDHIHLQEGKLCIFDCIEFNDRFRYIDIAADIAFLTMDLDFAGRPDLAGFVRKRMAELLQDAEMLPLMDFYKCYRACVRAKVEGIRALQEEVPEEEKTKCHDKVKRYMQLALRYSLTGSAPTALVVCGSIASGKSTLAGQLSSLLGICQLSSDQIRKKDAAIPLQQRSTAKQRASLYTKEQTDRVYRQLLNQALDLLQNGHSVVIDATYGKKKQREDFISAMEKEQTTYYFIECRASEKTVKDRLKKRESRASVSDARLEDLPLLSKAFEAPREIPPDHYLEINTETPLRESIRKLLQALPGLKQNGHNSTKD